MSTRDETARLADLMMVLDGRMTELVSAVRGIINNGVLDVELVVLPATGRQTFDFAVPFASIAVFNPGAGGLTVATGPERETAPLSGTGVQLVGSGRGAVLPLTGNCFTIYGTAGASVSLQVFATPQPPCFA